MYVCMYVCVYYVCMYACTLFGAPIGALGGIDVSQVEYACFGIYVYNVICMYFDCMYVSMRREYWAYYICMYIHI